MERDGLAGGGLQGPLESLHLADRFLKGAQHADNINIVQ